MGSSISWFNSSDNVVRVLDPEESAVALAAVESKIRQENEEDGYQVGDVVEVTVEGAWVCPRFG